MSTEVRALAVLESRGKGSMKKSLGDKFQDWMKVGRQGEEQGEMAPIFMT